MYSVAGYGSMIADDVRTGAYAEALRRSIGPDSVVIDIGAGTGILSFLACQFGARKVYAIEPSDAIGLAEQSARANGFSEQIEFFQDLSTEIDLPEKADVVVSDLHGVLPLFQRHIPSIVDARKRLLAPGGILLPKREVLWAAIVDAPKLYEDMVDPWAREHFDLDLSACRNVATNTWKRGTVRSEQLLTEPACWGSIDYEFVESPNLSADMSVLAVRGGTGHGLIVWFDAILTEEIGFSNAPGKPELVYGSAFFPWTAPVPLKSGDRVAIHLRAELIGDDYVWVWETMVRAGDSRPSNVHFKQSTFFASPLSLQNLRRRASSYRPSLGEKGKIERRILEMMDGTLRIGEIAQSIAGEFPAEFQTPEEALGRIGELSVRFCR
jgi:type I protein arginine methyltransferase